MTKFVKLKSKKQTSFLRLSKSRLNITWDQMAELLGISRSMMFLLLNETHKMRYDYFINLSKMCKLNPNTFSHKIIERSKFVTLPNDIKPKLAEFLGIFSGDGHMNDITYEVSITCDKKEIKYVENRVFYLFSQIFSIKPKLIFQENRIRCKTYSKRIVEYLSKKFGFPLGKKINKLRIPNSIINNNILLKNFLRGLFDTDGSFHRHHKNDAAVEFITRSPKFKKDIYVAINKLGFHPSEGSKSVFIYRKDEILKFFKLIKPKNPKTLLKYQIFLKEGKVPLDIEMRL